MHNTRAYLNMISKIFEHISLICDEDGKNIGCSIDGVPVIMTKRSLQALEADLECLDTEESVVQIKQD